jgi:hypothetical protein
MSATLATAVVRNISFELPIHAGENSCVVVSERALSSRKQLRKQNDCGSKDVQQASCADELTVFDKGHYSATYFSPWERSFSGSVRKRGCKKDCVNDVLEAENRRTSWRSIRN